MMTNKESVTFGAAVKSRYGHKVYVSKCGKYAIVKKHVGAHKAYDVSLAPSPLHLESISYPLHGYQP